MKTLALAAFALFTTTAFADTGRMWDRIIDDEINRLKSVNLSSMRWSDRGAPKSCKNRYKDLFKKGSVRIVYGFGYGDAGNNVVLDYFSYKSLKTRLLRPCHPDIYLCGFRQDANDPDLLRKAEQDATGEGNYLVELKLVTGALTGNDAVNTSPENIERQKAVCQAATQTFLNEVTSGADFVIYNGHSRDGGGPDFCPPKRLADQHVNYSWYHRNRPGIKALTDAMKTAKENGTPNSVVGLFSCSSQQHFQGRIMAVNDKAGLILTSRLATFDEMMRDSYAALDSLLAQRCHDGFERSFNARGAASWYNMFRGEP